MAKSTRNTVHRKRHGHHQKRTSSFNKVYHPFMPLMLIVTGSLLIFSVLSGPKPGHKPAPVASKPGANSPVLAYATSIGNTGLLNATNQRRAAAGVGALSINSKLNQAAQAKANDMASRNYWAHNTPEGNPPWTFITNAGYSYDKAGENLACGFDESNDVITGWYNSASHRENLLHPAYKDVGFGIANSASYTCGNLATTQQTIVVAMYGTPYTPPAASTPTTPAPTKTTSSGASKPKTTAAAPAQPTAQAAPETPVKHTVTFNVVDLAGKPAAGIKITLHSEPRVGYTDKAGNVIFTDVETGRHTVTLEIDGAKSETPVDLTDATADYKLSIVKPELSSNKTDLNETTPSEVVKPTAVSRLQTLTDTYAGWILTFLVFAVVIGAGYIIVKHSIAAHRFLIKGEKYILTHMYVDLLVVLLIIALYFLTRTVATIL